MPEEATNGPSVKLSALTRLPGRGRVLSVVRLEGMDGVEHDAVIWAFTDPVTQTYRAAYFDAETGEYLAEACP